MNHAQQALNQKGQKENSREKKGEIKDHAIMNYALTSICNWTRMNLGKCMNKKDPSHHMFV